MTYDHAQSPRLGQPTPVESPGVQLVTTETLPEVGYRGQIVYLLDLDKFRVFDGVAWQNPTADVASGTQTFVSPTPPMADNEGDLWMDSVSFQLYVWDGTEWQPTVDENAQFAQDMASSALASAEEALGLAEGKSTIWYTPAQPATPDQDPATGDYWINTVTNQLYRFTSPTVVVQIQDEDIAQAINDAGTAQSTADEKIQTFYTSTAPTGLGAADIGDLWFNTSSGNVVSRWNGASWLLLQMGEGALGESAVSGPTLGPVVRLDGSIVTNRELDADGNPTGEGLDITDEGLYTYDATGTRQVEMPFDSALAKIWRGDAEIDHLQVKTLTTLQETKLSQDSVLTMQNSVASPALAPAVSVYYDTKQFVSGGGSDITWTNRRGWCTDGTPDWWYTTNYLSGEVERFSTSGFFDDSAFTLAGDAHSICYGNGFLWTIEEYEPFAGNSYFVIRKVSTSTLNDVDLYILDGAISGGISSTTAQKPELDGNLCALTYDVATNELIIAQSRQTNADKVRFRRFNPAGSGSWGTFIDTDYGYNFNLCTLMYGGFDFGAGNYFIFNNYKSATSYQVVDALTGSLDTTKQWEVNTTGNPMGASYQSYTVTVTKSSGTPNLTAVSNTTRMTVGMPISGSGIPAGTYVTSVGVSTVTMSGNASTSGTITATLGPVFVAQTQSGMVQTYNSRSGNRWTSSSNATWYAAYTWTNGATSTKISPIATFTMKKRAKVKITTGVPVTGTTGSSVYLSQGSTPPTAGTSSMTLQGATSGTTPSRNIYNAVFTPTNNPTTSGFGSANPAMIVTEVEVSGVPLIRLQASGAGNAGPFKWDTSGLLASPASYGENANATTYANNWDLVDTYTEIIDTTSMFNPTTGRVTIAETGYYLITAGFAWGSNATGRRVLQVESYTGTAPAAGSGTSIVREEVPAATGIFVCIAISKDMAKLTAGDILRLATFQSSGGSLANRPDVIPTYFSVRKIT